MSTIIGRAAVYMAIGSHDGGENISAIGRIPTGKIFYEALTNKLEFKTNFAMVAAGIFDACATLHPEPNNAICANVSRALLRVGMFDTPCGISAETDSNNRFNQATPIAFDSSVDAVIGDAGDIDFYKTGVISEREKKRLVFMTTCNSGNHRCRPGAFAYDSTGKYIAGGIADTTNFEFFINNPADNLTFLVFDSDSFNFGSDKRYTVEAKLINISTPPPPGAYQIYLPVIQQ